MAGEVRSTVAVAEHGGQAHAAAGGMRLSAGVSGLDAARCCRRSRCAYSMTPLPLARSARAIEASRRPQPVTAAVRRRAAADPHLHQPPDPCACSTRTGWLQQSDTVSTRGTGGFPTPTGIFSITDKEKDHFSNIYRGALDALYAAPDHVRRGAAFGHRHRPPGLARLHPPCRHAYAIRLFGLTRLGARAIVADAEADAGCHRASAPVRRSGLQLAAARVEGAASLAGHGQAGGLELAVAIAAIAGGTEPVAARGGRAGR